MNGQPRYKVTELPSERTIRFYLSQGLIDKPVGRKGTSALYSYRHLLQILVIKYTQSQYLPLRKIKDLIHRKSNRDLERLLPEGQAALSVPRNYLAAAGRGHSGAAPTQGSDERPSLPRRENARQWARLELARGVELHLQEDGDFPESGAALERLKKDLVQLLDEFFERARRDRDAKAKPRH